MLLARPGVTATVTHKVRFFCFTKNEVTFALGKHLPANLALLFFHTRSGNGHGQ